MICPKCGSLIADDVRFCPKCGAEVVQEQQTQSPSYQQFNPAPIKKPSMIKRILKGFLIAILILIGSLIVIGLISGNDNKNSASNTTSSISTDSSVSTSSDPDYYEEGKIVTGSSGIGIGLVGHTISTGSTYNKPAEGKVFLLLEFEIENNSDSDIAISSLACFEAYCDDYSISQSLTGLLEKGNKNQLDGSVAAGKKMNGVIAYEVPADWQEFEITVDPTVLSWANNEVTFKIFNNAQ